MNKELKRKLRKQKYNIMFYSTIAIVLVVIISLIVSAVSKRDNKTIVENECTLVSTTINTPTTLYNANDSFSTKLNAFANAHNLELSEWNDTLISRGEENPEIHEYLLNYPLKKDQELEIDLSNMINTDSVPLLIQWDDRWGYKEYNSSIIGIAGCGPVCMSMVSLYLLDDPSLTPVYMAKFSEENKYCFKNSGTSWDLFSKGGKKLGLKVETIPNVEKKVIDNLKQGHPIICNVGEGCFTLRGHYIVLAGYEDGKIIVNDPNSKIRSEKRWDFSEFSDEIKNMWVFSK